MSILKAMKALAKKIRLALPAKLAPLILAVLLLPVLAGCGPKDIGAGSSSDGERGAPAPSTAEQLRYPMTGAGNTQRMLYYYNRPDVMSRMQDWQISRFNRLTGAQPSPEDPAYRAVPKQRSPFRQ